MALVKLVRDLPEVKGGNTEGVFPEEAIADLKKLGWKVADKGSEKKVELAKEEPKEPKVEPKVESKVEELKTPKFEEKKEDKVEKALKK